MVRTMTDDAHRLDQFVESGGRDVIRGEPIQQHAYHLALYCMGRHRQPLEVLANLSVRWSIVAWLRPRGGTGRSWDHSFFGLNPPLC
jgi:hypothetical protein